MSAAISACDRNAASPETATRSSASPRPATGICDSCWSSAPTMSSDHMEKTRPCAGGVSAWVHAAAAMREDEPLLPSRGSLLFCSIASGSRRRFTCRFMQRQLEIRRRLQLLRRSRVPMTAHGVGPSTRPTENWQHRLLLLDLNRHRAKGSYKVRIETRWRTTCPRFQGSSTPRF